MRNPDLGAVISVTIEENTGCFVLVLDEAKPQPWFWKFPGGKIEEKDIDPTRPFDDELTADNAAKRETLEEVGLLVRVEQRLEPIRKRTHVLHQRLVIAPSFDGLKKIGDEGEMVRTFNLKDLLDLQNFMPSHDRALRAALKYFGCQ